MEIQKNPLSRDKLYSKQEMKCTCTAYRYFIVCFGIRRIFFLFTYSLLPVFVFPQTPDIPLTAEHQLENNMEDNGDKETEDDTYVQQMQQYSKHPLNLNIAGENELRQLLVLNPLQVHHLVLYRNFLGKFINIYELQAIPGWSIELIEKLRPYVSVSNVVELLPVLSKRMHYGEHSILARVSQTVERSKGFLRDTSTTTNLYQGSPQKILLRYRYQFKNLLQYGIVGEKDAGEQFLKGKQKNGFDFYTAHFFAKDMGHIRVLALGDFTVNLGQGLIQWQSMAFKKSADVLNIKREGAILRPYNSAGEINFHRGVGITVSKNKWEVTAFVSLRKLDANFINDTTQNHEDFISSLQTSGYHRTKNELDDKGIERQLAFGGNISCKHRGWHISFNGIRYKFSYPLSRSPEPYNLYAPAGRSFSNFGFDYSYTLKNMHLFGEVSSSDNLSKAFISGFLISVAPAADLGLLYRNISKAYQSFYTNAFTESSFPNNEHGFYAGVSIHPDGVWRLDAYADLYQFPWIKFRVNAASAGNDYLFQLLYKPSKGLEIYSRFHCETKAINFNPGQLVLAPVVPQPRQNWRTQFTCKPAPEMVLTERVEICWFNKKNPGSGAGFLTYLNLLYKPLSKPWSGGIRLQYFETDDYNSRIYAYESDIMYSFSTLAFYDKGFRYYINANYDVNNKCTVWIKWEQTMYKGKTLIGSGLDEIRGNKKSGLKLQVLYKF